MLKIKRFYTALNRIRRSRGFGVHSPFAFHFIIYVLKEKLPYYAYERMPDKTMRLLFRVANYFNPSMILLSSPERGRALDSLREVSGKSEVFLLGSCNAKASCGEKLRVYANTNSCIDAYKSANDDLPFVVVDGLRDCDYEAIADYFAADVVKSDGVVVVLGIDSVSRVESLWNSTVSTMRTGMVFSNGKTGIIVCSAKLPFQNYSLWF